MTCDSARAVAMSYSLYWVPNGPTEFPLLKGKLAKEGSVCLLQGQTVGMDINAFSVMFSLRFSPGGDRLLTIRRSSYLGGQMRTPNAIELDELKPVSTAGVDGDGQDEALVRLMTGSALDGTSVHIPLAQRHAYDRTQDGNWQYVPLRLDYWGELQLRIGNPDIGASMRGTSDLPSALPWSSDLNISKLIQ